MKSKGQNHKMNEIITLSHNYKLHRVNLNTIKPAIDMSTHKRTKQVDKLKQEKLKYRQAIRDFNSTAIRKENDQLVKRIHDTVKRKQKQTAQKMSRINDSRISSRSQRGLKSVSSSKSFTSISSNYRTRIKREKQITKQNRKLGERILNPKSVRALAISQLKKSYQTQQEHVRTRSRFSQKNQQIIRSLALQGLHFDKRDVQYLPQLTNKRKTMSKSPSLMKEKSLERLNSTDRLH